LAARGRVFAIDATNSKKGANIMRNTKAEESGNRNDNEISTVFCYNKGMSDKEEKSPEYDRLLTDEELALAIQRRKEGMKLHEIEGNPLSPQDIAMFEMFERERWSHEKCRAYIRAQIEREKNARKK
jgi:hypothetical protein